jgi:hypothetical protein
MGLVCSCSCNCSQELNGIEVGWRECVLCREGDHWEPGDNEPFDWQAVFDAAEQEARP